MFKLSSAGFRPALSVLTAALALSTAPAAFAQAAAGAAQFKAICSVCHNATAANKIGPGLAKVVGRKAGTQPGFAYSPAMKKAGWVWTPAKLAQYINDPRATVPGNRMAYFGTKDPAKAKAIADYLATLK